MPIEWNELTIGIISLLIVAIWRQGLTSFTSGLMVGSILCGVLILKWIHNDVDRHKK